MEEFPPFDPNVDYLDSPTLTEAFPDLDLDTEVSNSPSTEEFPLFEANAFARSLSESDDNEFENESRGEGEDISSREARSSITLYLPWNDSDPDLRHANLRRFWAQPEQFGYHIEGYNPDTDDPYIFLDRAQETGDWTREPDEDYIPKHVYALSTSELKKLYKAGVVVDAIRTTYKISTNTPACYSPSHSQIWVESPLAPDPQPEQNRIRRLFDPTEQPWKLEELLDVDTPFYIVADWEPFGFNLETNYSDYYGVPLFDSSPETWLLDTPPIEFESESDEAETESGAGETSENADEHELEYQTSQEEFKRDDDHDEHYEARGRKRSQEAEKATGGGEFEGEYASEGEEGSSDDDEYTSGEDNRLSIGSNQDEFQQYLEEEIFPTIRAREARERRDSMHGYDPTLDDDSSETSDNQSDSSAEDDSSIGSTAVDVSNLSALPDSRVVTPRPDTPIPDTSRPDTPRAVTPRAVTPRAFTSTPRPFTPRTFTPTPMIVGNPMVFPMMVPEQSSQSLPQLPISAETTETPIITPRTFTPTPMVVGNPMVFPQQLCQPLPQPSISPEMIENPIITTPQPISAGLDNEADSPKIKDRSDSIDSIDSISSTVSSFIPNTTVAAYRVPPAQSLIVYLRGKLCTINAIAKLLAPLDEKFLYSNDSCLRSYNGVQFPEPLKFNEKLVEKILAQCNTGSQWWEGPYDKNGKLLSEAFREVQRRMRIRKVETFVKKCLENYLFWRFRSLLPHREILNLPKMAPVKSAGMPAWLL